MPETPEELYPAALEALTGVARGVLTVADHIDLSEMRSICERHQALAPIVEPTAYRSGGDLNLADQAVFLRAVDEFVSTLRTLDRRPDEEDPTHE